MGIHIKKSTFSLFLRIISCLFCAMADCFCVVFCCFDFNDQGKRQKNLHTQSVVGVNKSCTECVTYESDRDFFLSSFRMRVYVHWKHGVVEKRTCNISKPEPFGPFFPFEMYFHCLFRPDFDNLMGRWQSMIPMSVLPVCVSHFRLIAFHMPLCVPYSTHNWCMWIDNQLPVSIFHRTAKDYLSNRQWHWKNVLWRKWCERKENW